MRRVAAEAALRLARDGAELELWYGERLAVSSGTGPSQHRRVLDFLAEVGVPLAGLAAGPATAEVGE